MGMNHEWLKDPRVFKVNRLDPVASMDAYDKDGNSIVRNLDGEWLFEYAESVASCNHEFYKKEYDCSSWNTIRVPGHLQLQGYGTPMYVNEAYPWSASEEVYPGELPEYNQVGSYVREVILSEDDVKNIVHLRFNGVESAMTLWVNGTFVGYSEDTFTPSIFDITSYVNCGSNKIAVQVYRFSSGSWIEDQDFFRFSGIFRPVELLLIPRTSIKDLKILTPLYENYTKAEVCVDCELSAKASVKLTLSYQDKTVGTVEETTDSVHAVFEVNNPRLWSAEKPELYDLHIEVNDGCGITETVDQKVGIREFRIIDGLMCINGKRIVFHGVNRHEFTPDQGRVISYEQTKKDLLIMKKNNINALRSCHYPDQTFVFDLCDELGLYVIDEVNLETHGTWSGFFDLEHILPKDKMEWLDNILDRANSMYQRDKNHPSIIMWSLGNESLGGKVLFEESELLRKLDPSRVIHYEGIKNDRSYPDTSDIESQMYTPAAKCEQFIAENPGKPFMLCEYAHSMGNSNGGLFKYIDLEKRIPRYQGGFIWDFVDQALYDEKGVLRYGGDFKERPSDYDFCGNGIVFADRKITPKMQEVKYCYQYVDMKIDTEKIEFLNNYLFTDLNELTVKAQLFKEGELVKTENLPVSLQPGDTCVVANPFKAGEDGYEYHMLVTLQDHTGNSVAHEQFIWPVVKEEKHAVLPVTIIEDFQNIGVRGEGFHVKFAKNKGMTSYKIGDEEMLRYMPRPNFFRPSTNNDVENKYGYRYAVWYSASRFNQHEFKKVEKNETDAKIFFDYHLPNMEEPVHVVYTVYGDGEVTIDLSYQPDSSVIEMPAFGMMFPLYKEYSHVEFYGNGPEENYIDRNKGAVLGKYSYESIENMTPYLYPQECGNRTEVRYANISNGTHTLKVSGLFEFSVLPYTPFEIENARHMDELPAVYEQVLCVYEKQMGVAGDNTWGARTHDEFLLSNTEKHRLHISLKGE